ncbi:MAG: transglycosylase SLT domain-containing protein [Gammaproteobacteria bacterium]|nr:transglycosylase SLT domain-containing protein [Gammaproteobacteria bacterium]MBU1732282.1 transglycosylase SLT domain-containing protein [Gammaproteobacteria bacterium]MBU1893852.1 transglycosylase SLT domain-containing protein [Gammaproteobacteria bacterium]
MARVPTYDNLQATPSTLPNARLESQGVADFAGQQAQRTGQAMQQAGSAAGQIALDAQNEANQLRVIQASNDAKERMFNLLYDKDTGALNQKGWNALNRESGKDLPAEYVDRFQEMTDVMSGELGNDAQRKMFAQQVASMRSQLHGSTSQHLSSEFKTYKVSTYDGTVSTAQREIALMGASGDIQIDSETGRSKLDDAADRINAAIREKARLTGMSQEEADAQVRKNISNAHTLAIAGALEANKPEYADAYLKKYSGQMDADDILRVKGKLDGEVNMRIGVGAAGEVLRKMQPRIQTSEAERAFNIALGTESGHRQFGEDGKPLASQKGAIGIAQVMPGTGPEAAKMAGLPWDENRYRNDADYNKALGMAYFQKQLQDNGGDLQKAYAAYNAGPGRLQDAEKRAEKNNKLAQNDKAIGVKTWLDFMPAETKDYVAKNMKAFDAGQGHAQRPAFQEIDDQLRADPRLAGNPSRYKIARDEASRQYEEQTKAIKMREDDAVANAMRGVIENGGRYTDLPPSVRSAIPPKEVDNVIGFAQKISKGDDSTTPWLYNKLTSNPDALGRMSDNEFFALRRELSEADFKHFSQERAKRNGTAVGSNGPGDLNSPAIKQTLDERLRMLRIDPTPKDDGGSDAAHVGGIRRFVDQYFMAAQREAGKKFTDAEVSQHLDALFAKNVTFRGLFSNSSGPMLGMKAGDIDGDIKDGIKAAFKRQGIDSPTDAQILNAYWNMKVARK